ncbi:uncharacterized protein LOC143145189 isoform X1 [Ptiloglossa arizonensis]|uniref:uncharacterized protein LOC143145189 isoform X1 n=1 Tax=Ptiloglossa arizonensis TaxID=3350558 RepID=UPI003F9F86F0
MDTSNKRASFLANFTKRLLTGESCAMARQKITVRSEHRSKKPKKKHIPRRSGDSERVTNHDACKSVRWGDNSVIPSSRDTLYNGRRIGVEVKTSKGTESSNRGVEKPEAIQKNGEAGLLPVGEGTICTASVPGT